MARTACLVCFISTVNGHCNKKWKEEKKLTLGRPALVAGTWQTLSNLFWDFWYLCIQPSRCVYHLYVLLGQLWQLNKSILSYYVYLSVCVCVCVCMERIPWMSVLSSFSSTTSFLDLPVNLLVMNGTRFDLTWELINLLIDCIHE